MRSLKLIVASLLLVAVAGTAWGQLDTLYREYFTDSTITLNWFDPWTPGDSILIASMPGNPSGDGWVGVVSNEQSGGGVGTSLAGTLNMTDYEVQAQIYCTVNSGTSTGPYHAVIARWDSTLGNYYYFRTDFDDDQRLQLRKYPGLSGYGETIAEWSGIQIPGGVPTQDSWHHMSLKCEGDQLWVYWDGQELSGCPYTDDYLSRGFFGAYVFDMFNILETFCDDIIVLGEAGPQPFDFIPQDNHFLDSLGIEMILRPAEGDSISFLLDWDAINGVSTSPAFDITLEIDSVEIFRETNPGVEPNSLGLQTQSNLWLATLGEHTLRWMLDADSSVAEGNENNNVLEETFLVLVDSAYDFQADSAWVADMDTLPYPEPHDGDQIYFVLDWSVPMGSGPVGYFTITMDLDGDPYSLTGIALVQSGAEYSTVTNPWTAVEGWHYFEWTIDPEDTIDEFRENNNSTLNGLTVSPPTAVWWDQGGLTSQPEGIHIVGIYPNPFNPAVTLRCENAQPGILKLTVYDVAGRKVTVLADGFHPKGVWDLTWEAGNIAGGVYFAVLEGDGQRSVQPLLLVK